MKSEDPKGIAKGATRFTKNLKELLIAEYASKVITGSPYYKEGFSFQTGYRWSFSCCNSFHP